MGEVMKAVQEDLGEVKTTLSTYAAPVSRSSLTGCPSRRLDLLPGHSRAGLEAGRDLRADDQQRPREETLQQPRPLHCASQALLGEVLLQGSLDRPAGSKETGT